MRVEAQDTHASTTAHALQCVLSGLALGGPSPLGSDGAQGALIKKH